MHSTRGRTARMASLLGDMASLATGILAKEVRLARAEVAENASRAATGVYLLIAGLVFALVALMSLAAAAIAGFVAAGWSVWQSSLAVGVMLACAAAALALMGSRRLRPADLIPRRSVENLRQDFALLKDHFHA